MKLFSRKTGKELRPGDNVETFRGEKAKFQFGIEPHKISSTGRVSIKFNDDGHTAQYFPSVISAVWLNTPIILVALNTHMSLTDQTEERKVMGEFPTLQAAKEWIIDNEVDWPEGHEAIAMDASDGVHKHYLLDHDECWVGYEE